jgi:nucleotide-binding universal stress UspA family protein
MKKILVPLDFSPIAENALKYAIGIASEFKSELYLYHVYTFDRFNYDTNLPEEEQPYPKQVQEKMNKTISKFNSQIKKNEISIHTVIEKDIIFSLFERKVKKHGIDLIVMGTKGASGLTKVIFGSVAAIALETSQVPVLVVPPSFTYQPLKHIVLATDESEVSPEVLSPLHKLAHKFKAKVTVLNIDEGEDENVNPMESLDFDDLEIVFREVPLSKSINDSINEFIGKGNCDLLCMVRRDKSFFERLLNKSITKAQVFNSQIPLLVLPEND